MARAKKDGQYLNVKITADLYRDLMEISEIAGQTKTTVVERALEMYFNDFREKQEILSKAAKTATRNMK